MDSAMEIHPEEDYDWQNFADWQPLLQSATVQNIWDTHRDGLSSSTSSSLSELSAQASSLLDYSPLNMKAISSSMELLDPVVAEAAMATQLERLVWPMKLDDPCGINHPLPHSEQLMQMGDTLLVYGAPQIREIALQGHAPRFQPWHSGIAGWSTVHKSNGNGQQLLKRCLLYMLPRIRTHYAPQMLPPQDEQAHQHMITERGRRKRQSECFTKLKYSIPGNIKRDKISILEGAVNYLRQLSAREQELLRHVNEVQNMIASKSFITEVSNEYEGWEASGLDRSDFAGLGSSSKKYVRVTETSDSGDSTFYVQVVSSNTYLELECILTKLPVYLKELGLQVFASQSEFQRSKICVNMQAKIKEGSSQKPTSDEVERILESLILQV